VTNTIATPPAKIATRFSQDTPKAGLAVLQKMNIASIREIKKNGLDSYREVGNVVHHYITSLQKVYDDFLVLEVASDEEKGSSWHQASDNLLLPN
jgi:hypothetical protein